MNRVERRRQESFTRQGGHLQSQPPERSLLKDAVAHHKAGRFQQAEQLYHKILTVQPDHAEALHLCGLLAYQVGQYDKAVDLISQAIQHDSQKAHYCFNLALAFQRQDRLDQAIESYQKALAIAPEYVEAHSNLGNAFREQSRLEDAVASYKQALRIKPDYMDGHNNLGVALKELGQLDEAAESYTRALTINPWHAEAHCNLGIVLNEQKKLDQAIESFEKALAIKPDYAKAHHSLGLAFMWQKRFDRAAESFKKSADLLHNHGRPLQEQYAYPSRLKHDVDQIQYLLDRALIPSTYSTYLDSLKRLRQQCDQRSQTSTRLRFAQKELTDIAPSFNRILYYADCPVLPHGALNRNLDVEEIEARYNRSKPEIIYIDDLFEEEAVRLLRTFCLESTIWKKDYENGYIGAFLGDGFSSPLLLQMAEELRLGFPGIFKDHLLLQAWAFKHDSELKGLNIHADAAAVNVNFWITPDEANLDPSSGGLVVWDKEAPQEWNFKEYNNQNKEPEIREFLQRSGAKAVTVPHRQNRALVFNSDLFHKTDEIRFRDDYESRRINVTFLYGRRFS